MLSCGKSCDILLTTSGESNCSRSANLVCLKLLFLCFVESLSADNFLSASYVGCVFFFRFELDLPDLLNVLGQNEFFRMTI